MMKSASWDGEWRVRIGWSMQRWQHSRRHAHSTSARRSQQLPDRPGTHQGHQPKSELCRTGRPCVWWTPSCPG